MIHYINDLQKAIEFSKGKPQCIFKSGDTLVIAGKQYKSSNGYDSLSYVTDYLYEMTYSNYDYDLANSYFKNVYKDELVGGCSSAKFGNWFTRNFDWNYDEQCDIILNVPKTENRYASLSVASNHKITKQLIESGEYSETFQLLPFFTVDGINSEGLAVSVNVVPIDFGKTNQKVEGKKSMGAAMIPRYILDNHSSAEEAVNDIKDNFNIYQTKDHEVHFLVADKDSCYCLEFINNETEIIDLTNTSEPFITNFHIKDVIPYIYDYLVPFDLISDYGMGVERYQKMLTFVEGSGNNIQKTFGEVRDFMNFELNYTRTYTNVQDIWRTEYTGNTKEFGDLTVSKAYENPSAFNGIIAYAKNLYENRDRSNPNTWQTVHTSIYSLSDKKLFINVQENKEYWTTYEFKLEDPKKHRNPIGGEYEKLPILLDIEEGTETYTTHSLNCTSDEFKDLILDYLYRHYDEDLDIVYMTTKKGFDTIYLPDGNVLKLQRGYINSGNPTLIYANSIETLTCTCKANQVVDITLTIN